MKKKYVKTELEFFYVNETDILKTSAIEAIYYEENEDCGEFDDIFT